MVLEQRNTETRVKHVILSDYLARWIGIITSGLSGTAARLAAQGRSFQCRFLYVDGFSHNGRYTGDAGDLLRDAAPNAHTWGSPIIGIQALDKAKQYARQRHHLQIQTTAILTEINESCFQELRQSLDLAGLADRVSVNPQTVAPGDDQIIAIYGNFLDHLDSIVRVASMPYTWSFFLIDPYGPKGMPYDAVSRIVNLPSADVMINLMYLDLQRRQGILTRTAEVPHTPAERALLQNYDAMFGTDEWRKIVHEIADKKAEIERGTAMESALVDHYAERLRVADAALAIKRIQVEFPDQLRTMFYLFLTTHDPTGALALNEVLHKAKLAERGFKLHFAVSKWIHAQHEQQRQGQLTLFDVPVDEPEVPPAPKSERIDVAALADEIWWRFQGKSRTIKQVYAALANTDVFASEVEAAITKLKRDKHADYQGAKNHNTLVHFRQKGS